MCSSDLIDEIWNAYSARTLSPEEKRLTDEFAARRADFIEKGLVAGLGISESGGMEALSRHVRTEVEPRYQRLAQTSSALVQFHQDAAAGEYAAAKAEFTSSLVVSLVAVAVAIAVAVLVGIGLMRAIRLPLARMEEVLDAVTKGDHSAKVAAEPMREFQNINAALRAMKAILGYNELEKAEMDAAAQVRREADMERIAGSLDARVAGIVEIIQVSAGSLLGNSQTLSGNADQTMAQAGNVTVMTGQVTGNVQAVSAATHELSSSVDEISRQVSHAAVIAAEAVEQATRTDAVVRGLSDAAQRIGEVVRLINDIASQTNLLALNATIEAARAGEAGKGFAVVAHEVKSLANQTARATGEIGSQIAGIQSETKIAVEAIRAITGTIENINELSAAISAAVEEQGAATQEIARSVSQAAEGTHHAAENVSIVAGAAEETKLMADQVTDAAKSLQEVSEQLAGEVRGFLAEIRAA